MEQPSFGFEERLGGGRGGAARGHHVLGGRAQLAGARFAAPGVHRRGLGAGRGAEPEHVVGRAHLLLAGREGGPGRPGPGPPRRRAVPRRPPGRHPGAGRGAGRRARQRRRGAHQRAGHGVPAHRALPARDDRHRSGVHRRRASRPTGSGCCARSPPKGCSARTRALELAAGPAPGRVDHELGQRGVPRLRPRAGAERLTRGRSPSSTSRVQGAAAARRIKWALGQLSQLDLDAVVRRPRRWFTRRPRRRSTPSWWRVRSRRWRCRSSPASGTRPTAASPTRSRTHACKTPTACAQLLTAQRRRVRGRARRRVAAGRGPGAAAHGGRRARARRRRASRAPERSGVRRRASRRDSSGRTAGRGAGPPAHRRGRLATSTRARARVVELGRRATRERTSVLAERRRALVTHAGHQFGASRSGSSRSEAVVRALDPRRVLERGYSITRDGDGPRGASRPSASLAGAILDTELAGGRITSRVETHHGGTR